MLTPVRVLLFATAREAVGRSSLSRPVPDGGVALEQFLGDLAALHPRLGPVLRTCRVAQNGEILPTRSAHVRPGDELALYPPFSGG